MGFTVREALTIIHGMVLGGLLLLVFSGVLAGLWSLKRYGSIEVAAARHFRILTKGMITITILAWLTVITGTYLPYPWYRATPPPSADLARFPMAYLLSNPRLAFWEDYGLEWKEHLAWFAPILMTAATFIIIRYREKVLDKKNILKAAMVFLSIAFIAVAIAGILGALVTKIAPVR